MKIALIHDWLTGMRGGEKCLEVLCRRFPDARLFTLLHVPGTTSPRIERMRITTSFLQRFPGVGRYYRYLLPLMPGAVERLRLPDDVDLVVSFSHAVAKSVRPPQGVPHVCYCFTPMRYAWHRREDYFVASKRLTQVPLESARNQLLNMVRQWDQATSERVTEFIAISRTIQTRIRESYGRESQIIYPPVDTEFYTPSPASAEAGEPYYLCLSALVPYKRIDLAVDACNRLGRRLVVIGSGPERTRLESLAGPHVEMLGWVSDEEIRHHLRTCRALLFPGNEDFGIVPVEAQACGTPVIAYGEGGATETVLPASPQKIGSGLFFSPQDPQSLVEAIERFEAHPEWFSSHVARARAERFRAERFEEELVGFLEEVVARGVAAA